MCFGFGSEGVDEDRSIHRRAVGERAGGEVCVAQRSSAYCLRRMSALKSPIFGNQ